MNKELKLIFGESITVDGVPVPAASIKYKGNSTSYITWTITGLGSELSADDEPLYGVCTVDVDVFGKGNILNLITEAKKIMKNNDWIWTGDSPDMYEEDTGYYHKTISFEKERAI